MNELVNVLGASLPFLLFLLSVILYFQNRSGRDGNRLGLKSGGATCRFLWPASRPPPPGPLLGEAGKAGKAGLFIGLRKFASWPRLSFAKRPFS